MVTRLTRLATAVALVVGMIVPVATGQILVVVATPEV